MCFDYNIESKRTGVTTRRKQGNIQLNSSLARFNTEMKTSQECSKRKMIVKMLFVFLMILDVVAVLHFAIELGGHETSSGTRSKLQATLPKPKKKSGPSSYHIIAAISEFFSFFILLICNILGIYGINQNQPYQLIPWLVVYMIGIISAYIGSFLIFSTQETEGHFKWDGLIPLSLAVVFHIFWNLVKDTFNKMKYER